MKKNIIKINEAQLRNVIKETVKKVLKEGIEDEHQVYHYVIYQIDSHNQKLRDKLFRDYDTIVKKYGGVNFGDYTKVYEGDVKYTELINGEDILEALFEKFNIYHPFDYRGRSLSVGDIVEVNGQKYYCNSYGWQKI